MSDVFKEIKKQQSNARARCDLQAARFWEQLEFAYMDLWVEVFGGPL